MNNRGCLELAISAIYVRVSSNKLTLVCKNKTNLMQVMLVMLPSQTSSKVGVSFLNEVSFNSLKTKEAIDFGIEW